MINNVKVIFIGNDLAYKGSKPTDFDVPCIYTDVGISFVLRIFRKIFWSKNHLLIKLPFKNIWGLNLNKYVTNTETQYYFIFTNARLYPFSPDELNTLYQKSNVHYVLLWGDPFDSIYSEEARYYFSKVQFDYIFTINPADVKEKGFIYTYFPYNFKKLNGVGAINNDIYFAGAAKDRLDFLLKIYKKLIFDGVNVYFRIVGTNENEQKYNDKIVYNQAVPYESILDEVKGTNCILEVLSYNQTGASLRYYEAIVYNKKLLTNNKNVVNLPFYNPKFIHIFDSIDDIDTKWIIEREDVDFHYDGSFSLSNFVNKLMDMESEKAL